MDIQILQETAMSFTGLTPPNNAKYIGQRKTEHDTFFFYKDDKGEYWYETESGRRFEKKMQEAQKNQKSYRKRPV